MKKRADGRYQKKITINGKQKIIYGKTQKEVFDKIYALKQNISSGTNKKHSFKELADEMLDIKQNELTFGTLKGYKETLNKFCSIYSQYIEDIEIFDIQLIINKYHSLGLSKSSLNKIRILYSLVAKYAITKGIKIINYSPYLQIPKNAAVSSREDLTDTQISIINNNLNHEFGLYPYLMLYTGLRRGELCALKYEDIDYSSRTISVNKAVEFIYNRPHLKEPKTKAGIRNVPLLDNVAAVLPRNKSGYIFGGSDLTTAEMIKKRWSKYCRDTNLDATQHQLRHAYATMLYKAGVDPKTAQVILGHSDIQTTMNRYTHIAQSMQTGAAEKLNNMLR